MTDRTVAPTHVQVHTATHRYEAGVVPPQRYEGGVGLVTPPRCEPAGFKPPTLYPSQRGPSTSQVLAVVLGLPVGGFLLLLAGLTLAGTFIGLLVTAPLFILFSPILVPATVIIGLAVAGFLTSGAFGLTALSSFSWMLNYIRECQGPAPENLAAAAKHRLADAADYVGQKTKEVGQKTKEVGQDIQNKAQDAKDASARDAAKDTRDVKRTTLTASTTATA